MFWLGFFFGALSVGLVWAIDSYLFGPPRVRTRKQMKIGAVSRKFARQYAQDQEDKDKRILKQKR